MIESRFEKKTESDFGYIVFEPENKSDERRPLIVSLHGADKRGNGQSDLNLVKEFSLAKYISNGENFPAVILCPQCPSDRVWNNYVNQLKTLIDNVVIDFNIDPDRISITGVSMGGYGTWEMGITYPGFFCSIAPVCGGGMSWRVGRLIHDRIWAFHGDSDSVVPYGNSVEMVDKLFECGGYAKLTIFHKMPHDCIDMTYKDTAVINWMLSGRLKK